MILVDRREPAELVNMLRQFNLDIAYDPELELPFGDLCFEGNGETGQCTVGIERKKLSDLVNSMKDRRLSGHQLRGMQKRYEYCFLVAEGSWRPGKHGEIETMVNIGNRREWRPFYRQAVYTERSALSYIQLNSFLFSLQLRARTTAGNNLMLIRTWDAWETAAMVSALYHNFTDKLWYHHHAHDQIYSKEPIPNKGHGSGWAEPHVHDAEYVTPLPGRVQVGQDDPTTVWRWAAQLPGIDRRSEVIARHFKTARDMANATEKQWMDIDFGIDQKSGRRNPGIGLKTAKAVIRAITEEGA